MTDETILVTTSPLCAACLGTAPRPERGAALRRGPPSGTWQGQRDRLRRLLGGDDA